MDGNFSEKLKAVLSDPDAMSTITGLAKNLAGQGAGNGLGKEEVNSPPPSSSAPSGGVVGELLAQPAIASALRLLGDGSRERIALLMAMRPFVKEEKKEKLDRIIQTMKTLDLLLSARSLL